MRRYRFRLDPVLRVRRDQQDLAQAAVLLAQADARHEAVRLTERDQAYARANTLASAQGPRSAADFLYEQQHRQALATAVLDQRGRVEQAEGVVVQARVALTAAATKVGALERLDERQRAEHAVRALREEELIIDDLVVSRFSRAAG